MFVTAREYGQTLGILELLGMPYTVVGQHGGASKFGKVRALGGRSARLARLVWKRRPDLAIGHGSVDLAVVSAAYRVPSVQMQDYEFARLQRQSPSGWRAGCWSPTRSHSTAMAKLGVKGEKLVRYPGLRRSTTWPGSSPTRR